jgi:hypothetical protein
VSHPIDRLDAALARVRAHVGERDAATSVSDLDDDTLLAGLADIAGARKALSVLESAFAAEVERRSDRSLGYSGLAQREGHRSATALVQHVTGQTRTDVRKAVATGRDLLATTPAPAPDSIPDAAAPPLRWFHPLVDALTSGLLSREQYDAIRRGLGEPPEAVGPELEQGLLVAQWSQAVVRLIEESGDRSVEDLRSAAHLARDSLDPKGVQTRFDERFANRSYRWWVDERGQHRASLVFDDDSAAWMRTILSAALRPRRGPRFVDSASKTEMDAAADGRAADERSNEQLQYDTLMAVLRTGAAADPTQAFGDRQPGVRIVVTREEIERRDETGSIVGSARFEETGQTLPGSTLETYLCNAATKVLTVDPCGRPLDVGRERRLFTSRQRDALAIRDGGCRWCGAEPSRCEAHHIDHWWEHAGRTDVDDGVLLCRNCHMRLHNQKWRIRRIGDEYWLHAPVGANGELTAAPRRLVARSLLRFEGIAS